MLVICEKNYSNLDDKTLIDLCWVEDNKAFNEIVKRYHVKIINICYRFMGTHEEAEDVAQEILIKVFNNIKKLKDSSAFFPWLYTIIINTCKSKLRSPKYKFLRFMHSFDESYSDEIISRDSGHSAQKRMEAIIQDAINSLSINKKVVVVLYYIEGLSCDEIASITNAKLGTIHSRLGRAREELAEILKDKNLYEL